jgi:hypothetical protein
MPREKQIEFPPEQTHVSWLTPFMLLFSVVCIVVVIILTAADVDGPFIGPW